LNANVGDRIDSIDGQPMTAIVNQLSPYSPASNATALMNKIAWRITRTKNPESRISITRTHKQTQITISNYIPKSLPAVDFNPPYFKYPKDSAFAWLKDSIGYINIGRLQRNDSARCKEMIARTKGLVIDNRQNQDELYGTGASDIIGALILPTHHQFVRFSSAQPAYPGVFRLTKPSDLGIPASNNPYRNKVAILINENSISVGEFITMAFQMAPHVRLIGTTTTGADGNVTYLPIPGGAMVQYTGLGVYYPDGGETQRTGLHPNITVRQTWAGFQANRDQQLERAIEWVRP